MGLSQYLENRFYHLHPTNPMDLNLQWQLNLHLNWPISGRCRRHLKPPHTDMWHLLPPHKYPCRSFTPVLHSDMMLLHDTCPDPSWSVPLRDASLYTVPLCHAPSHSAMPGTSPCHPWWSAKLCVAPSRSGICAAPRHQNISRQYWGIDPQCQKHGWTGPSLGYLKTHTSTHPSPPYQET